MTNSFYDQDRSSSAYGQGGARATQSPGNSRGALIGVALAGAALGFLANFGRKLVVQAPTAMAGDWDQGLAAEHKLALANFDALLATSDDETAKRATLFTTLRHALTKHTVQEETIVYPALREHGMAEDADELNHEHGYVKQYFYDLEVLPKDSPLWLEKVRAFRAEVAEHAAKEENELYPRMKAQMSAEATKALTLRMHKAGLVVA